MTDTATTATVTNPAEAKLAKIAYEAYLANGNSPSKAAAELKLSISTMQRRIRAHKATLEGKPAPVEPAEKAAPAPAPAKPAPALKLTNKRPPAAKPAPAKTALKAVPAPAKPATPASKPASKPAPAVTPLEKVEVILKAGRPARPASEATWPQGPVARDADGHALYSHCPNCGWDHGHLVTMTSCGSQRMCNNRVTRRDPEFGRPAHLRKTPMPTAPATAPAKAAKVA